ncbi:MAG TPA: hypothetical protein VGB54_04230, partial [Allosphingosinicella sp.]
MSRRLLLLPALLACSVAAPATAQIPRVQTQEEALAQDAGEYARNLGVSVDEATRRLRAQAASVAATDRIARAHADRLAGIAVEHRPEHRIVVLLTGDDPVAGEVVAAGGATVPIVFRTGARATRAQVVAAMARHQAAIRAILSNSEGMGHDGRTGELVVMADTSDLGGADPAALNARLEALTGVPVRIRLLDRPDTNFGLEGGARVEGRNPGDSRRYFCTTGFVVTDGSRNGIVTAAHCPDSLTYIGPGGSQMPLEFVGQWGAQFQDVQVHVGAGDERPTFYSDRSAGEARTVTGARLR